MANVKQKNEDVGAERSEFTVTTTDYCTVNTQK